MRFSYIGFLCLYAACGLNAQTPNRPTASPDGTQRQSFALASVDWKKLSAQFYACKPTTIAGLKHEIEANSVKTLVSVTINAIGSVLAADTGEGRATSEILQVAVSKLRVPAMLALFADSQAKAYQELGFKLSDPIESCSPTVGPSQLIIVRRRLEPGLQTIPSLNEFTRKQVQFMQDHTKIDSLSDVSKFIAAP
jgi:hypothetical protein